MDISEVKLLTNIHLFTSNKKSKFYKKILVSHEVPAPMYYNQSGPDVFAGTLKSWGQVMDQEDETDVMDELREVDQIVNFTRNSRVPGRSALQGPYQSESKKIVAMFKNVQCNRHPLHKSVQNMPIKKTVTFNEDVTTH